MLENIKTFLVRLLRRVRTRNARKLSTLLSFYQLR